MEDRHWRPANVDESCLAHPVAMDTVRSSSQHVCVCVCVRERETEREKKRGREGREDEKENQQAGVRASQSGIERAPDSRV